MVAVALAQLESLNGGAQSSSSGGAHPPSPFRDFCPKPTPQGREGKSKAPGTMADEPKGKDGDGEAKRAKGLPKAGASAAAQPKESVGGGGGGGGDSKEPEEEDEDDDGGAQGGRCSPPP